MKPKILEIRKGILEENDILANKIRADFARNDTLVINIVSSPGSGKTELLTKVIKELINNNYKVSAIVGDLATDNDAKRIKSSGAETHQINTNGACHLDANMVIDALKEVDWINSDFLFIENVGNLVCPAGYDLGENLRFVLMSVTEGEDKPLKYPTMFNSADVCVISKIDLAEATEFNSDMAYSSIKDINPSMRIIETSSKANIGIDLLANFLIETRSELRG